MESVLDEVNNDFSGDKLATHESWHEEICQLPFSPLLFNRRHQSGGGSIAICQLPFSPCNSTQITSHILNSNKSSTEFNHPGGMITSL